MFAGCTVLSGFNLWLFATGGRFSRRGKRLFWVSSFGEEVAWKATSLSAESSLGASPRGLDVISRNFALKASAIDEMFRLEASSRFPLDDPCHAGCQSLSHGRAPANLGTESITPDFASSKSAATLASR